MGLQIDRKNKTGTINGLVFNFVDKGQGKWEIYENGRLWGQFVAAPKTGAAWGVAESQTFGTKQGPRGDAQGFGLAWLNSDEDET